MESVTGATATSTMALETAANVIAARPSRMISGLYARGMRSVGGTCALLTLTALLAGCGSSYTNGDFVARANAICASAVRQTRSIAAPSAARAVGHQMSALADYLAQVVPVLQSEASQLRALRRPTEDASARATLARYLEALAQAAGDYRALAAAAKRGDAQGVASAEAALRASPVASLAASYGLHSCGIPGATLT
jgi:hypothetical protein